MGVKGVYMGVQGGYERTGKCIEVEEGHVTTRDP